MQSQEEMGVTSMEEGITRFQAAVFQVHL